jgi:hypothetical protein
MGWQDPGALTDFNGNEIAIGNTPDGLPDSAVLGSSGDTITTTYDSANSPSVISLTNSGSTLQSFTYSDAGRDGPVRDRHPVLG